MREAKKRAKFAATSNSTIVTIEMVNKCAPRIRAAGIEPSPELLRAITAYCNLLLRWNRKINLTTITDPGEMISRNFVESFYGARWLEGERGTLCDVGSGAGFPGLALKLVKPGWAVRLFEPNLKKAAFLAEVSRQLGLEEVEIVRRRWEASSLVDSSLDAITARAVGGYEEIAQKAYPTLKHTGKLLFWIGCDEARKLRSVAGWKWEVRPLPDSRERVLLIGRLAS